MNVFVVQTIVMVILAFIIFYLIIYNKTLKLEKRIGKYSVSSINNHDVSFFDFLSSYYNNLVLKLSKVLKKSKLLTNYSKKYNKYITYENDKTTAAIDYVSNKFYISILFIFIIFFARTIEGKLVSLFDILFFWVLGFFIMDIYFMIYDNIKKRKIEQDLLNAIIIMNNAFRSGRSVMQAIEIVSQELKGPISQEFKKMHLEITYGLSLDVVFDRFSKRVNSSEVSYITSSLSILNKTGGNIIKVFASIEKMLFDKRKLKTEMKSLTSSSKMLSLFLLVMPFILIIIIFMINEGTGILGILRFPIKYLFKFFNDSYFSSLFKTTIGNIVLGIIIILYLLYVFVVNKVMKVRFE